MNQTLTTAADWPFGHDACKFHLLGRCCALLERNKDPSELEIRQAISGNLCRCTGYNNIVKAVQHAAEKMR